MSVNLWSFSDGSRFLGHVQRVHVQSFINTSQLAFFPLNTEAKGDAVAGKDEDSKHSK